MNNSKSTTTTPQILPAVLALEGGHLFHGISPSAPGSSTGEVVFNTGMTGYQEILTDPSYHGQIVTLTHPHIGNVGVNALDAESRQVFAGGLVVRELSRMPSNWRSEESLPNYMASAKVPVIAEVDTRRLTRLLRMHGALRGAIVVGSEIDISAAQHLAESAPRIAGQNLVDQVTTDASYQWQEGLWQEESAKRRWRVTVCDFGVKKSLLRHLVARGCAVDVVPANFTKERILNEYRPDGILLSNGPGDPAAFHHGIRLIQDLIECKLPMFGVCLGHQLLCLALGAATVKMKFGHHGTNHPVVELATNRVCITSQNHGFAVDAASLPETLVPTHRSLFDGSLQGVRHTALPLFSLQGHPEASPGPHDKAVFFDQFIQALAKQGKQ